MSNQGVWSMLMVLIISLAKCQILIDSRTVLHGIDDDDDDDDTSVIVAFKYKTRRHIDITAATVRTSIFFAILNWFLMKNRIMIKIKNISITISISISITLVLKEWNIHLYFLYSA